MINPPEIPFTPDCYFSSTSGEQEEDNFFALHYLE